MHPISGFGGKHRTTEGGVRASSLGTFVRPCQETTNNCREHLTKGLNSGVAEAYLSFICVRSRHLAGSSRRAWRGIGGAVGRRLVARRLLVLERRHGFVRVGRLDEGAREIETRRRARVVVQVLCAFAFFYIAVVVTGHGWPADALRFDAEAAVCVED